MGPVAIKTIRQSPGSDKQEHLTREINVSTDHPATFFGSVSVSVYRSVPSVYFCVC